MAKRGKERGLGDQMGLEVPSGIAKEGQKRKDTVVTKQQASTMRKPSLSNLAAPSDTNFSIGSSTHNTKDGSFSNVLEVAIDNEF